MTQATAVAASYVGVLLYSGFIFLGAGTFYFPQGHWYVALAVAGTTLNHLLVPSGSARTVERAREAPVGQAWDKRILGALFLVNIVTFVTAGLDAGRFGWSGSVPLWVTFAGAVLMLAGQVIFALAKRENAFFSSTVRVQTERGHSVVDTGPYRLVRHPGYLGMLLSQLAFPLLLNAYWAFPPATVGAVLLGVRTVLEDRFLREALPGYAAYAKQVRWRLIPGVL